MDVVIFFVYMYATKYCTLGFMATVNIFGVPIQQHQISHLSTSELVFFIKIDSIFEKLLGSQTCG